MRKVKMSKAKKTSWILIAIWALIGVICVILFWNKSEEVQITTGRTVAIMYSFSSVVLVMVLTIIRRRM